MRLRIMFGADRIVSSLSTNEPEDRDQAIRFGKRLANVWLTDYLAQDVEGAEQTRHEGMMKFYPELWMEHSIIYSYTMVAEKNGVLKMAQIQSILGTDNFLTIMNMITGAAAKFEDVAVGGPIGTGKVKEHLEKRIPQIRSCFYKREDSKDFWFDHEPDATFDNVNQAVNMFGSRANNPVYDPTGRHLNSWYFEEHQTEDNSERNYIVVPRKYIRQVPVPALKWEKMHEEHYDE
jgi:hypothetical protein